MMMTTLMKVSCSNLLESKISPSKVPCASFIGPPVHSIQDFFGKFLHQLDINLKKKDNLIGCGVLFLASQDALEVFSNSSIYIFRISIFHVATSYINELSAKYAENPSAKRTELSQDLAWAGEVARWLLPTSSSESFSPNEWQPFKGRLCVLVPRQALHNSVLGISAGGR